MSIKCSVFSEVGNENWFWHKTQCRRNGKIYMSSAEGVDDATCPIHMGFLQTLLQLQSICSTDYGYRRSQSRQIQCACSLHRILIQVHIYAESSTEIFIVGECTISMHYRTELVIQKNKTKKQKQHTKIDLNEIFQFTRAAVQIHSDGNTNATSLTQMRQIWMIRIVCV